MQRLSTIRDFVDGKFSLTKDDLEYLKVASLKVDGAAAGDQCSFAELLPGLRRRLHQTQITANVIDPQTPEQVKFDIFKRINTGGSPLNAQEIRHSMMRKRCRDVLKDLAGSRAFEAAVPRALRKHRRMADREVILRYLAFALDSDWSSYPADTTMDEFLMNAARKIDDESQVSASRLDSLRAGFERAMTNAKLLFESNAFRKWPAGTPRQYPFNKALFESWAFALRDVDPTVLSAVKERIVSETREAMGERAYNDAITVSTGDAKNVKLRFEVATSIVQKALP